MLSIQNLIVSLSGNNHQQPILQGLNLTINPGEIHVIMGPNGSGKSTLANVLAGRPGYEINNGTITYNQENLLTLSPEERARAGIFLAFQYPIELPGVNNMYFLRTALNAIRKERNLQSLDAADFLQLAKNKLKAVGLNDTFLHRSVNEGFSGGEKKRNEILQMLLLEPSFIILDETDSGLDIDALQLMSGLINQFKNEKRSFLIVTHYQRLLEVIEPDAVHVMTKGQILKTGNKALSQELEKKGYHWLQDEINA